jgi:hypothetical protein
MTLIYLILGCLLLITSSLLLRKTSRVNRWLSLVIFIIASICFIAVYGSIGGIFVAISTCLLTNLFVAFIFGKATNK